MVLLPRVFTFSDELLDRSYEQQRNQQNVQDNKLYEHVIGSLAVAHGCSDCTLVKCYESCDHGKDRLMPEPYAPTSPIAGAHIEAVDPGELPRLYHAMPGEVPAIPQDSNGDGLGGAAGPASGGVVPGEPEPKQDSQPPSRTEMDNHLMALQVDKGVEQVQAMFQWLVENKVV